MRELFFFLSLKLQYAKLYSNHNIFFLYLTLFHQYFRFIQLTCSFAVKMIDKIMPEFYKKKAIKIIAIFSLLLFGNWLKLNLNNLQLFHGTNKIPLNFFWNLIKMVYWPHKYLIKIGFIFFFFLLILMFEIIWSKYVCVKCRPEFSLRKRWQKCKYLSIQVTNFPLLRLMDVCCSYFMLCFRLFDIHHCEMWVYVCVRKLIPVPFRQRWWCQLKKRYIINIVKICSW